MTDLDPPIQIQLPLQLQTMMQSWDATCAKITALELKASAGPVPASPALSVLLAVAAFALGLLALLAGQFAWAHWGPG